MLPELEVVVDTFVVEPLGAILATEELIRAFAEEPALDGVLDAFVEVPASARVVDGVVEAGAGADPNEDPDAARAGTAVPARARKWCSFMLKGVQTKFISRIPVGSIK